MTNPKLEDIDFTNMSMQELEDFARVRFRCLYFERQSFQSCGYCDGYNRGCTNMITASHLEVFYKLFEWKP